MARSLDTHLDPTTGPKRILACDGGGVKGILTLGLLEALEAELRRRSGDPALVLSDYYDLIGGTSTGAIVASGLSLGLSVKEMIDLYMGLGPVVFGRRVGDGNLFRSKYDPQDLRKALAGTLGKRTVGSRDVKTGLALHMKRIDTGSSWVISNHPKSVYYDIEDADSKTIPNKKFRLIDLVMASAAAPTFFDEVCIALTQGDNEDIVEYGWFVDGAVGANNNPSLSLLMLALVPAFGFGWRSGADNLMMTSVGTGLRRPRVDGKKFAKMAPGFRGIEALRSMIFDTQIQGIMLLQALSEPKTPWDVNSEVREMRGVTLGGGPLLDFQRIDARLDVKPKRTSRKQVIPRTPLEALIDRDLTEEQMAGLDELANGKQENMELLLEIGRATGRAYVGAAYPDPRFDLPEWRR